MPCGPVGPSTPVAPGGPVAPAEPNAPASPVDPMGAIAAATSICGEWLVRVFSLLSNATLTEPPSPGRIAIPKFDEEPLSQSPTCWVMSMVRKLSSSAASMVAVANGKTPRAGSELAVRERSSQFSSTRKKSIVPAAETRFTQSRNVACSTFALRGNVLRSNFRNARRSSSPLRTTILRSAPLFSSWSSFSSWSLFWSWSLWLTSVSSVTCSVSAGAGRDSKTGAMRTAVTVLKSHATRMKTRTEYFVSPPVSKTLPKILFTHAQKFTSSPSPTRLRTHKIAL